MKKALLGISLALGLIQPAVAGVHRVTSVKGGLAKALAELKQANPSVEFTDLIVKGEATANDLFALRDSLPDIRLIDLSGLRIEGNALPDSLFFGKIQLQRFTPPNTLQTIGRSVFENSGLTQFVPPTSLERIGARAFKSCSYLEICRLSLATKLRYIGVEAFCGCLRWDGAFPTLAATLDSLGQGAFAICEKLTGTVTLPDGVRVVGFDEDASTRGVFEGNVGLTALVLGKYTEHIAKSAFLNCTHLGGTASFFDHATIGDNAFSGVAESFKFDIIYSLYVATDGNDSNDGASWHTPKQTVAAAIEAINNGRNRRIFIAEGTYTEASLPALAVPYLTIIGGFSAGDRENGSVLPNDEPDGLPAILLSAPDKPAVAFLSATAGETPSIDISNLSIMGQHVSAPLRIIGTGRNVALYNVSVHAPLTLEGGPVALRDTLTLADDIDARKAVLSLENLIFRRIDADAVFYVENPHFVNFSYEWSLDHFAYPLFTSSAALPLDAITPFVPNPEDTVFISSVLTQHKVPSALVKGDSVFVVSTAAHPHKLQGFSMIAPYSLVLGSTATYSLYPVSTTPLPENIYSFVEWIVSDTSMLAINGNTITGKGKAGEVRLTARFGENEFYRNIYIGQIAIDIPENTVIPTDPLRPTQFSAALLPAPMEHRDVAWAVDDSRIATVDGNGLVTPRSVGAFTLTAYLVHGPDVRDTRTYYVGAAVEDIVIPALPRVNIGDTVIATAYILPANALMQKLQWTVSDSTRLRIIETTPLTCKVVGLKAGDVELQAKAIDGGAVSTTRKVTVNTAPTTALTPAVTPMRPAVDYTAGVLTLARFSGFRASLYAVTGQAIETFRPTGVTATYRIPLRTGIYILSAEKGNERFITKFVVK
ncbi:MAG: leucine-rich repeat protein [Tannerellaceae bacterium]|jgi:hypothetical protein|nr:leucine-rich repeat protein [Tannerellaceae bacterium]